MKNENIFQKLVALYFFVMALFWADLVLLHSKAGNANYWFSFLFGLTPLVGGIVGMTRASVWGGLKSALGKAVFFVSLGLALWGLGETVWSYYNFFRHVPAPYPSLADVGFAPSIFFWILGAYFLAQATGAIFAFKKSHWAKLYAVGALIVLFVPSYFIQVKLARGGVLIPQGETTLKAFLDIAYPVGDFLALLFAAVVYTLSYRYFGGMYRRAVTYLLAGLAAMYGADTVFSFTTTKGTYYNADWGDLLLALGVSLITFGILAFATKPGVDGGKEGIS